ncbi:cytochrome b/b6 domain-containing protein [Sphingomonas sp. AOB5]|uniref:cytochrome b/b6 domain-containing protein n=1 Tax=Sphingomonas sp. AOB5 TaxID=3034017 RepID=UPI0023F878FD|nr:cytochrome b/b6 domain-containing protein [Sphingomonas sp. AOB5]MDF7775297.1 cytochrome b/b6 domain-containing protein [Sphingomonas sp. AOB5]
MSEDAVTDAPEGESAPPPAPPKTRLWDLPVRLVHWSFALLLPALWWTWKSGDMSTHRLLGYVTLGLLLFRIYWGFAGSSTARFASFVRGPRAVFAYARGLFSKSSDKTIGHNPIGALSVLALLGAMLLQVALGLFAQDTDGIESGPLSDLVSYELSDLARDLHEQLFNIILALVALHLLAILFYALVKRDNLVGPMITGRKALDESAEPPRFAPLWRGLVGVALAAGVSGWVAQGLPLPGVN